MTHDPTPPRIDPLLGEPITLDDHMRHEPIALALATIQTIALMLIAIGVLID